VKVSPLTSAFFQNTHIYQAVRRDQGLEMASNIQSSQHTIMRFGRSISDNKEAYGHR